MAAGAKVTAFTVVMLLVAAALVVVFGQFRFGAGERYHAQFTDASRLTAGQDVRMAGLPVGKVDRVSLSADNTVDVLFSVDSRYRLYTSTRAVICYLNLTGDRYLELAFAAGDLHALAAGATIPLSHTQPAVDLDALLGGLRPVLKGLDGDKVNAITAAVIDLLQGQGGAVSQLLSTTGNFAQNLSGRDQHIGDVVTNLNVVLGTVDSKSRQFGTSIDTLQQLLTGLARDRDSLAGAIAPLAASSAEMTQMLERGRRPVQGVLENVRPFAQRAYERKAEVNAAIEPLAESYLRLNSLGAYGAFFNIFFCSSRIKLSGPAGSDIIIPIGGAPDPSKGRCSENG
ncbi:MCE family protein [Mycobacterium sp. 360MFTsu5.1]|uniref:MCE family protein n=1 Tax=Mycobacterium sp. 360MFTsu5.1 TaxID=1172186 RepID=UPI000378E46B|nr:MCE family protein [Mycobacterium sp. 360MFTsu5.1]